MQADGDDGQDFIFMHPLEFEPDPADFDDYATWNLIGTEQGPDALLGPAHEGNDADAVRRRIGVVFQAYNLFPHLSVLDNITLGPRRVAGLGRREVLQVAGSGPVLLRRSIRWTGDVMKRGLTPS